jgi:hypothetical protein
MEKKNEDTCASCGRGGNWGHEELLDHAQRVYMDHMKSLRDKHKGAFMSNQTISEYLFDNGYRVVEREDTGAVAHREFDVYLTKGNHFMGGYILKDREYDMVNIHTNSDDLSTDQA